MNSQALMFWLGSVTSALQQSLFDDLVKDGKITQGELASTKERVKDIANTLKNTPVNKIEALLAQSDAELVEHLEKFNREWAGNYLAAFQDAEILLGLITSILAKGGDSGSLKVESKRTP